MNQSIDIEIPENKLQENEIEKNTKDFSDDDSLQKGLAPVLYGKHLCLKLAAIIFALVGVFALSLGLGLSLGLKNTPIVLKDYNETCMKTSECKVNSVYGLVCASNICTCTSTSYYSQETCLNKITNGVACNSSIECNDLANLSCQNVSNVFQCSCSTDTLWNGTYCGAVVSFNQSCSSTVLCDSRLQLSCQSNVCLCSTKYWSGTTCVNKKTNGLSCVSSAECNNLANLSCRSLLCSCGTGTSWNGTYCDNNKLYNQTCNGNTSICSSTQNLYCDTISGLCNCKSRFYPNNLTCLAQKSFNTSCSSSIECRTDLNLNCISNQCVCNATSLWSSSAGACVPFKTYNDTCNGYYLLCNSNFMLTCQSSVCQCPSLYFWDEIGCSSQKTYGDACTADNQCLTSAYLFCNETCSCAFDKFWNSTICQRKLTNNEVCDSSTQCQDFSHLSCQSSTCQCDSGWIWSDLIQNCFECPVGETCTCTSTDVWSPITDQCVTAATYNQTCSVSILCDSSLHLTCQSNVCLCPTTRKWWDGTTCQNKKTYTEACAATVECLDSQYLVCNATCTCTFDKYWNTSTSQCAPKATNGEYCDNSIPCQEYNQLTCENNTCNCPPGVNWFWATATETCVSCPSNWTIYQNHCYYVNTNKLNWNNALAWCQSNGASLMSIRNENEYQLLYNFYVQYSPGGRLWIGAKSTTLFDFKWTDNTDLAKNSTWWCSLEPNNSGGNNALGIIAENCVFMWTAAGRICLNDYTGTSAEVFACEKSI